MNFHKIKYDDMLNGSGIRCVLFVSGCEHECHNCHNPQTWCVASGNVFSSSDLENIKDYCKRDYVSGLTFSGGDPLHYENIDTVTHIAKEIKSLYPDKNIWCYTGFKFDEIKDKNLMDFLDVVIDGKYIEKFSSPSPRWRGSTNQKIYKKSKVGEWSDVTEISDN